MEETGKGFGVRCPRFGEVTRPAIPEKDGQQRSDAGDACARHAQAGLEPRRLRLDLGVDAWSQQVQSRLARRHHHRVSRQCAGLVHGAGWRDKVHQVGSAPVGADGQAAADDLAENREVRADAVQLLCSARCDAEAGDDLVEDQQRARLRGQLAEPRKESGGRRDHAHVGGHRLHDHCGDIAVM